MTKEDAAQVRAVVHRADEAMRKYDHSSIRWNSETGDFEGPGVAMPTLWGALVALVCQEVEDG